jgi:mannose-6-phosphate isomerase-like protein (cupin superfamily)
MSELKWVDLEKIEGEDKGGRTSWIMVSEKTVGSQNLAVGMNETHVGGKVPQHMHNTEEEVMFFISGKGQFVTENEIIELRPGICVYNPPGGLHEIINTGDEILKFIWIYAPQLKNHRLEK